MNAITEAAETLRKAANALDRIKGNLYLPAESYTLQEAVDRIRAVFPGSSLSMNVSMYSGEVDVIWSVWDGHNHHNAKTLTGAVNAALASATPAPAEPLKVAQELLDGVTVQPDYDEDLTDAQFDAHRML